MALEIFMVATLNVVWGTTFFFVPEGVNMSFSAPNREQQIKWLLLSYIAVFWSVAFALGLFSQSTGMFAQSFYLWAQLMSYGGSPLVAACSLMWLYESRDNFTTSFWIWWGSFTMITGSSQYLTYSRLDELQAFAAL